MAASKLANKDGGLGVRRVALVALPAYLTSVAGTISLYDGILAGFACPTDPFFDTFRQTWLSTFGTSPPPTLSYTNSLSGTGRAFCVICRQWNHAASVLMTSPFMSWCLHSTHVRLWCSSLRSWFSRLHL